MTKELEQALRNIDTVCANAVLKRDLHIELQKNLELIRKRCEDKK